MKITVGTQAKITKEGYLLVHFLQLALLLLKIVPTPIFLGTMPTIVGRAPLYQLTAKKMPTDILSGQCDGGNFSTFLLSQ